MEKIISFLILIIIGVLFRGKVKNKEQKDTIGNFFASPLHLIGMSVASFVTSCILLWKRDRDTQAIPISSQKLSNVTDENRTKVPAEIPQK